MPPLSTPQLYNNYDKAIVDQLVHPLTYPPGSDGRPILHVWATPERALAQVERKLNQRPDDAQKVFPLPFASVDRLADAIDPNRFSRAVLRRTHYIVVAGQIKKCYSSDWPIPITLTYQLNLWARNLLDLNDLQVQFLLQFNHAQEKYLTVEHDFPIGQKIVYTRMTEIARPSSIQEPEKQRLLRQVFTFVVSGWIVRRPQEFGIVEKVTTDMYDSDDLETEGDQLGRVVVTEAGRID